MHVRLAAFSVLAGFTLLVPTMAQAQAPGGAATAPPKKTLQQYVVDAMRQVMLSGAPSPKQKKVFETEAPADAQAFVTNYRAGTVAGESTPDIQVDKDKLADYLKFDASLYSGATAGAPPRVCVRVRAEHGCSACQRLAPVVEGALSQRIAKRGFNAQPGPLIDIESPGGDSSSTGDSAFDEYAMRATDGHCDGTLYGELKPERSADTDDEGEDIRVTWTAYLGLKDLSGGKIRAKAQAAGAVGREESDAAATRSDAQLLTNRATADLYAQAGSQAGNDTGGTRLGQETEEHYLRLSGISSYAVYAKFKEVAAAAAPTLRLEERIIKPGEIDFAVPESLDLEKLGHTLHAASWGGQTLQIVSATSTDLEVALK